MPDLSWGSWGGMVMVAMFAAVFCAVSAESSCFICVVLPYRLCEAETTEVRECPCLRQSSNGS